MAKSRRRVPRYEREARECERDAAEDAARAAAADARSHAIWIERVAAMCAKGEREREAERQKYWAAVDPAKRLWRIRPFDVSPHHGLTKANVARCLEIKQSTLGYQYCTILTFDENREFRSEGPLGAVASHEDAERLRAALAAEFPHVPFRIELMEELLEFVVWRHLDDAE